jgi:hypothetical protein
LNSYLPSALPDCAWTWAGKVVGRRCWHSDEPVDKVIDDAIQNCNFPEAARKMFGEIKSRSDWRGAFEVCMSWLSGCGVCVSERASAYCV